MRGDAKPRFDPERFTYFRRELAGFASAISPDDPSRTLRVLNKSVLEVAELCTGYATVDEIRQFLAARYQKPADGPLIRNQVDEALLMLAIYNLITLDDEHDTANSESEADHDESPTVRRLEEWDFNAFRLFLSGGTFPDKPNPPIVHFRHPYTNVEVYSEMLLRMRLFHGSEHVFALERGTRLEFVATFFDERPLKPVASLALIAGIEGIELEDGFAQVFTAAERDLPGRVRRLEARLVEGRAETEAIEPLLVAAGYEREGVLRNAFGPGASELVFGRLFEEKTAEDPDSESAAAQPDAAADPDAENATASSAVIP